MARARPLRPQARTPPRPPCSCQQTKAQGKRPAQTKGKGGRARAIAAAATAATKKHKAKASKSRRSRKRGAGGKPLSRRRQQSPPKPTASKRGGPAAAPAAAKRRRYSAKQPHARTSHPEQRSACATWKKIILSCARGPSPLRTTYALTLLLPLRIRRKMACHPCSCPICAEHQVDGSAALAVAIKYLWYSYKGNTVRNSFDSCSLNAGVAKGLVALG